jgi:dCMP deaminase
MNELQLNAMRVAYYAASRSNDRSTQNGAILMNPKTKMLYGMGFNHIAECSAGALERFERPLKYQWTEHAERHSIYSAAKYGNKIQGAHMYCCWAACADCARAIAHSGIAKLIRHTHEHHLDRADWLESIRVGDQIMREHGVEIEEVSGKVGAKILFNGRVIDV